MINGFAEWAAGERLIQTNSTDQLNGRCVAIDAEDYIHHLLTNDATREPLLPALGGCPFALESHIESQIALFKEAGIKPFFVFHGLLASGEQRRVQVAKQLARKVEEAWELYNASKPDSAVAGFGTACTFDIDHIYRFVQSLFSLHKLPYLVAPYSAHPQMVYMEGDVVDAICGSSELLMYDCQRVILDLDLKKQRFTWVTRQSCIDSLTNGNPHHWIDSCLLAGSSLLPTLPHIDNDSNASNRTPKIRAAADLLKRTSTNGNSICLQYQDDLPMLELHYLDNFRKAYMSIQHHIIITYEGEIRTLNKDTAPNDVHAFIGQRLPDEIYYYVSRGAIGTRVLTWRTSGQVVEKPPVDGGASITYENLVRERIVPQRVKALALLSQCLHRFYQHNDVMLQLFLGSPESKKLNVNDAGDLKQAIAAWHVRKAQISERLNTIKSKDVTLSSAVECLASSDFAKATVTPKPHSKYEPLRDVSEIKSNALWRYLQLHEYIDQGHQLTPLGKALQNAYKVAESKGVAPENYAEPILLGVELLRLQLLNRDNMFPVPPYHGQPYRGSETDQKNTLLVSRVACLGGLKHNAIGFTGPLSRHLLGFRSLVSVVRQSQRDLLDMSLLTMFLDGDTDRQIPEQDLKDSGLTLPFVKDIDCALGIAVKHYLDELSAQPSPISPESRKTIRDKGRANWFPHAIDFAASLEYAFALWDALYTAVKELPKDKVSEATKKEWEAVNAWLGDRR